MTDIKDISGKVRFSTPIGKGSKRKFTLQKEDYIILKFSLYTPVYFKLGDYMADSRFGRFELCDFYKPTYNTSTGGYDYDLRLDAHYWKWKNKIFKFTPEVGGQEASWNLTATLDVQMGVFLRNLKALNYTYNGKQFEVVIDPTVDNKSLLMSYDNVNLLDAIFEMAKKWECECWITDSVIHFGRCEFGDPVDFELTANVDTMDRSDSRSTFATRVYAFGSTRNIPTNYRPVDESVVVNGVVQRRLMLPSGTPYIDAYPGMSTEEAIEDVVVFDDVYPRRTGTMSDITTKENTEKIENADGTITEKKWLVYRYKDTGLNFSKDYIIPGNELKISFQTGSLRGMEFAVTFNPEDEPEKINGAWNPKAQLWEIVRNEDYGRPFPDIPSIPKDGNTYILSGFDTKFVSDTMLPAAEQELKEKAEKYVDKTKIDPSTYSCKMKSEYMVDSSGMPKLYEIGDRVNLVNRGFFETGSRQSRIIGFEYNLDYPYDSPVYTVGETASYSRLGDIESKIDSLTYKGQTYTGSGNGVYLIRTNDSTPASNSNAFSSLKSLSTFLRKDQSDQTDYLLKLAGGAIFGKDYIPGLLGLGGSIDKNGYGELRGLRLWETLEVPELRYNRVSVYTGIQWQTFGAGLIEEVTPDKDLEGNILVTGTIKLKLEEGEIGAVAVDDLCMGIWHDFGGTNSPVSSDDRKGNFHFAGFNTSYFRITEILDEGTNKIIRYALRPVSSGWNSQVHPAPHMNFAAYSNPTNKSRQACKYSTTEYSIGLVNMTTWEIQSHNIIAIDGKIDGWTLNGKTFEGYGTVIGNAYIYGSIEQWNNAPIRMDVAISGDTFMAPGESKTISCTVMRGWEDITTEVERWTIERDSGDAIEDMAWNNSHQDFSGSVDLTFDDLGSNIYTILSVLFTITAYKGYEVLTKQIIEI